MAAVTISWNPESPAGSDAINAGDDVIIAFKQALSQRLRNGGHKMPAVGTGATLDTEDGRHTCGESTVAGSSETASEFNIYDLDSSTVVASFRGAAHATAPSELYLVANGLRTTGTVKAATINATLLIKPDSDAAVDLGVTATNRFRDLFLSRNAEIGGTLDVTGVATFIETPVFSGGVSGDVVTATTNVITGGVQTGVAVLVAGATLTAANCVVFCDVATAGGGFTVALPPAAAALGIHYWIHINRASGGSAHAVIINPDGAETIENPDSPPFAATLTLLRNTGGARYGVHIVSNGTQWELLNQNIA